MFGSYVYLAVSQILLPLVAWRTCRAGADVASMTHTVRLSSPNTLGQVQVMKNLAIVAVAENSK